MNRRMMLGMLMTASLVLAGGAGLNTYAGGKTKVKTSGEDAHTHGHFMKCAKECADCQQQCDSCFHHCAKLVADGKKEHAKAMHLCVDCADLCATAGRL